jgi:hypothetical protein
MTGHDASLREKSNKVRWHNQNRHRKSRWGSISMADADDLRKIALSLTGVTAAPHVDRVAFRAERIFTTLAANGLTANLRFTPEHQAFKTMLAPAVFSAIPNGFGRMGWTTITLAAASLDELESALRDAYVFGAEKRAKIRKR